MMTRWHEEALISRIRETKRRVERDRNEPTYQRRLREEAQEHAAELIEMTEDFLNHNPDAAF